MDFALYFHWPFCESKCPYCDFNSHVRNHIDQNAWLDGYITELKYWAKKTQGRRVTSIFFGGGTPSLMNPDIPAKLIEKVRALWACKDDLEITLEANPSSIEAARFKGFYEAGINRVSIGVQSLRDDVLKFLERPHNADEARQAIDTANDIFDRVSFDLIYGHPMHSPDEWRAELKEWLPLTKGHLSAYQLTIEQGTNFATRYKRGELIMPSDDTQAEFFDITMDECTAHDLNQYEVSNYAANNQESQHNLTYWHMKDYIGIGPGAHGRITLDDVRYATVGHKAPEIWLERVTKNRHGGHPFVALTTHENLEEKIMMGLRLNEGILVSAEILSKAKPLIDEGYLIAQGMILRPTRRGMMCLNAVITRILT